VLGRLVGDVIITKPEIDRLMGELLYVASPPAGTTRLSEWARKNSFTLGLHYTSELARRLDRRQAYRQSS
ncbi:MAG TPA: hypothetical protein VN642_07490, partial [Dongiaceae bacterium]|nr:hypothetical protein [Dongiaceae bacterium]